MKKGFKIQYVLLYPLSLIYGIIVWFRNCLFDFKIIKSHEFTIPVISVGNITVGGTGKTPHVEYLVRLLKEDYSIATLSRGYKRKTSGFILSSQDSIAEEIGDEPCQIKHKFPDINVAVDANRVRGINTLISKIKDLKVVILDDAFQHRYVTPGLNILLVDYSNPLENDHLLPFGKLREHPNEKQRADIIIVTKCPSRIKPIDQRLLEKDLKTFAYQKLYFTTLEYGEPIPVFKNSAKQMSFEEMRSVKPILLLLTGIANPRPLKTHIRGISTRIEDVTYPDHYAYTASDMHELIDRFSALPSNQKFIITTEKDAMRLHQFPDLEDEIKSVMYYIPVHVEFSENDAKSFNSFITNYVRNNKPDSILYQPKITK
jgi:tetraacyldisaccharide 4'-kinase